MINRPCCQTAAGTVFGKLEFVGEIMIALRAMQC